MNLLQIAAKAAKDFLTADSAVSAIRQRIQLLKKAGHSENSPEVQAQRAQLKQRHKDRKKGKAGLGYIASLEEDS